MAYTTGRFFLHQQKNWDKFTSIQHQMSAREKKTSHFIMCTMVVNVTKFIVHDFDCIKMKKPMYDEFQTGFSQHCSLST